LIAGQPRWPNRHLNPYFHHHSSGLAMTQADRVYEHLQHLPESMVAEVLDFVQFLEQKHQRSNRAPPRVPGSARGQVWMADDFDAPLEDFKDYQ
jgi:hypothetical protein